MEKILQSTLCKEVFQQSSVPQVISTIDFSYSIANKAFYDILGYSKEQRANFSITDVLNPENHD